MDVPHCSRGKSEEEGAAEKSCCVLTHAPIPHPPPSLGEGEIGCFGFSSFFNIQLYANTNKVFFHIN